MSEQLTDYQRGYLDALLRHEIGDCYDEAVELMELRADPPADLHEPQLLEACRLVRNALHYHTTHQEGCSECAAHDVIDAAIAATEGAS